MTDINLCAPEGEFNFAARAVIMRDGHMLMVKDRLDRYFYSVGGRVKIHESAAQAAKREAEEETGALFEVERLLFVHENFFSGNNHEISMLYLMRHTGGEIRTVTDRGEELVWLPVDRLSEHKVFPHYFVEELPRLSSEIKHFVMRGLT